MGLFGKKAFDKKAFEEQLASDKKALEEQLAIEELKNTLDSLKSQLTMLKQRIKFNAFRHSNIANVLALSNKSLNGWNNKYQGKVGNWSSNTQTKVASLIRKCKDIQNVIQETCNAFLNKFDKQVAQFDENTNDKLAKMYESTERNDRMLDELFNNSEMFLEEAAQNSDKMSSGGMKR